MKEIEIASSFFCGVRKFFLFFVRRDERDEKTEKWLQKTKKIQKKNCSLFALFLRFGHADLKHMGHFHTHR